MTAPAPLAGPAGAEFAEGGVFGELRTRLTDAAAAFTDGPDALAEIMLGLVDDVDRAVREPLEIFPVCHHSPASALAMARRLREKRPRVIYLELCEDLAPLLAELRNCRLPVALQAFAGEVDGFPAATAPLSVIAPITEASAEYQAIAYALGTPGVELVLVDRSADHVYQWDAPADAAPADETPEPGDAAHGDAVGVGIGDLRPRFADLERHLLRHGRVRHWSEWWHQYVELPLAAADHDSYRQAMFLIGGLFRRLAPGDSHRLRVDEDRERYMWTRIREHQGAGDHDPAEALYVCGAFHAASRVAEFGLAGRAGEFTIPPRTATRWQYGLIPSSHAAIEAQFALAPGSVSIAAATWAKALKRTPVRPFRLGTKPAKTAKAAKAGGSPRPNARSGPPAEAPDRLTGFLVRPGAPDRLDEEELVEWSVEIVRTARRHGYLASTADTIAIFETSILLAGMRDRARPTPYDFQDAAVTCLEKDTVPGRLDVRSLVERMLGGDRNGRVGYESLPPLARDVHDRLAPLGLPLERRGVHRALLDITGRPELAACSDVLWMLRRLLPERAARPIMGERGLGERSPQESWDLSLGTHQRELIELGYEGVGLEQVLEQRLRRAAHDPKARAADVLAAVEDAELYLPGRRLAPELGGRALTVLAAERGVEGAPEVLRRVRRLLTYYRTTLPELPAWIGAFATTGFAHYCTLLPTAFGDEDAHVREVGAMLGFLFSMEGLAVSMGCDRRQLELALAQSRPTTPEKTALLWAARTGLGQMDRAELRAACADLLDNPLTLPAYPRWLGGFLQALVPVPQLVDFVVEAVSAAFDRLPDHVLLPWLPTLVLSLRDEGAGLAPLLTREAARIVPGRLTALDAWVPPWRAAPPAPLDLGPVGAAPVGPLPLLRARPESCDALAALLGVTDPWAPTGAAGPGAGRAGVPALFAAHPEPARAWEALLAGR
ncbi:hypothetical protein ACN20G_31020 (plasmid) [Streptomyces sp. BI20]|uniref:hypothetical protein n=1 Tax=Streptomyces sp. BI20 TaxID=3403460 RepID=UPI003C77C392